MSSSVALIGGCAVVTFVIKGIGPLALGGRDLPLWFTSVVILLAPALFAALVATQVLADGRAPRHRRRHDRRGGGRARRVAVSLGDRLRRRRRRRDGCPRARSRLGRHVPPRLPIRRNTVLLASALAANSAMLQLSAAVASLTLVLVARRARAARARPGDRARRGRARGAPGRPGDGPHRAHPGARRRVLRRRGGLRAGGGRQRARLGAIVLLGLVAVGAASGTALLARTAAGDMYPPERRAHGIALVLFGAVFGAILGPLVFSPLLAGRDFDGDALAPLWLAAGAFMLVGLALVLAVRPDPRRIAAALARAAAREDPERPADPPAAPLRELLRPPGRDPGAARRAGELRRMVGVMTLTGAVVVDHFHHAAHHVFPIIGAHVVGMYALVIVVGDLIDRIGRTTSLAGGLLLMARVGVEPAVGHERARDGRGAVRARPRVEPLVRRGDGELADRTEPWERGKLLGLQRPALRADRRGARAARRRGADRARGRGARDRRRGARRSRPRCGSCAPGRGPAASAYPAGACRTRRVSGGMRSRPAISCRGRRRGRAGPTAAAQSPPNVRTAASSPTTAATCMLPTPHDGRHAREPRLHAQVQLDGAQRLAPHAPPRAAGRSLHGRRARLRSCARRRVRIPVAPARARPAAVVRPQLTLRQPPARTDSVQAALVGRARASRSASAPTACCCFAAARGAVSAPGARTASSRPAAACAA